MKQSEAIQHLREFAWALQRYRSITMETLGPGIGELHLSEEFAGEMWPWVFGEKCPLPVLSKMLGGGGYLEPMAYYNMMYILFQFMPEILLAIQTWRGPNSSFPQEMPDTSIVLGWEE